MIERGRVFCPSDLPAILVLVEVLYATVNPKMERLREVLYMGRAMRSFMFPDPNTTCVGDGQDKLHGGW